MPRRILSEVHQFRYNFSAVEIGRSREVWHAEHLREVASPAEVSAIWEHSPSPLISPALEAQLEDIYHDLRCCLGFPPWPDVGVYELEDVLVAVEWRERTAKHN